MAELTISSDEIRSAIANYTSTVSTEATKEEIGVVVDTSDGIAHISGLPSAMANELLEFPGGILGVALNRRIARSARSSRQLDEIAQAEVRRTGDVLWFSSATASAASSTLGQPIDGLGDIEAEAPRLSSRRCRPRASACRGAERPASRPSTP